MNVKEQMKNKIMTEERMFELTRKYLRNMEIRHWCFLCFGAFEEVSALVHGRNVILHPFGTTRNKQSGMTGRALSNALVARGAELRSEILDLRSRMTGNKVRSGMTGNKSNVILSLLGASGSVVRMARLVITKVACGSKDSDGAFAFSAQPLRMTGKEKQSGMVRKKEQSGMTGNKSNVILSLLWASEAIVRRSMVRIVKVACGSKDSDGAFAFSAQPLRMTGNNGLVKVVICNVGVIC